MNEDQKEEVGESRFAMIRCLIAMAHADGEIQPEERHYIDKMMSHLDLTESQKKTLDEDFTSPPDALGVFDQIKDPKFKSQAIHFARLMAWKDNELDPGEQAILEKLQAHASKSASHDESYKNLQNSLQSEESELNETLPEKKDRKSVFSHFFDQFFG